jgi:polyhydroxyalkanoate synthesis regulator phasin
LRLLTRHVHPIAGIAVFFEEAQGAISGYHGGDKLSCQEVFMLDTLERLILLQIGAAAVTRERVQDAVNRLIEQGRMEREEGRAVVEDVVTRARERSTGARSLIDASVQQGLRGAGVPNREAYEDLLFRIEQLEHRVRLLEDRPTVADPDAPTEPLTPPVDTPPPPPVGDVDVTRQAPTTEPDIPPGLQPDR